MKRTVIFKIGSLCIAIILFCFINVQMNYNVSADYRRILIRGTQNVELLIVNKRDANELEQTVYEQDRLTWESEIDIGRDNNERHFFNEGGDSALKRFDTRQLSENAESDDGQEYYDNSIPDPEESSKLIRFTEPHLTPVMSSDAVMPSKDVVHLCVVVCEDRATEALTMLKSAAMVSRNTSIVFHIIADEPRQKVMQTELEKWPKEFSSQISYFIYNVTLFDGTAWNAWKSLYKPCAVQRLFLPDRLLNVDSLIYVDTDTVFMHSIVNLWDHFKLFNSSQLIALVKESEDGTAGWYNRFANHPYYGDYGVNSGVMLMNLTRLRKTRWLSEMQSIYQKYQLMITWGDQDLINIYFSVHPGQLYIMPCEWNYRTDHCMYVSNCKTAEHKGVSLLHGSRGTFYENKEPTFKAIHQAFEQFTLGDSVRLNFMTDLQQRLKQAPPSNCGKVHPLFLNHLSTLSRLEGSNPSPETRVVPSSLSQKDWKKYHLLNTVMNNRKRSGAENVDPSMGEHLPRLIGPNRIGLHQRSRSGRAYVQGDVLSVAKIESPTHQKLLNRFKMRIDDEVDNLKRRQPGVFKRENVSR